MKTIIDRIKFLFKEYLWIIYILIISEFFFVNKFLVSGFSASPIAQFVMNVAANLCVLFFINIFFNKKITIVLFSIFILLPNFFEQMTLISIGGFVTQSVLGAMVNTNGNEIKEFMSRFLIAIPLLMVYFAFIILAFRQSENKIRLVNKLKIIISCIIVFLTFNIVTAIPMYKEHRAHYNKYFFFLQNSDLTFFNTKKVPPLNFYHQMILQYDYISEISPLLKKRESFTFNAKQQKENAPEIVVLIIGERMRYRNWEINGYERPNNPYLKQETNLISFNKNFSNGNSTIASIPFLLTDATPKDPMKPFEEKTIISLFKECGYKTYWISNQPIFFLHNENEPDTLINNINDNTVDDIVINQANKIINDRNNSKKLIVINLLGGHGKIPESFKTLHYKQLQNLNATEEKELDYYDNLILYHDFIISKLFDEIKKTNKSSLLYFTADHGTLLYDDDSSKNRFGYGSEEVYLGEINTPMFVMFTDKYGKENAGQIEGLKNNINKLTTNDNLFNTISDMSLIKYNHFNAAKSFSNPKFVEDDTLLVYNRITTKKFAKNQVYEYSKKKK
ncbi:MAG TPA: phosphoethanolamine transferase [Flavobacterium sp.]|uniref:phosphoethanolamine transferase n=1 Tax=Flavobacterium sp. TaxID=239 RepID=UPI002CB0F5F4|nr:phosphoethanolamine transferase [Flavobacterium sp.]HNP32572.1 phosphoethanolamine transferase [Flavobacterium sp.]